jgi:hypothetical protein
MGFLPDLLNGSSILASVLVNNRAYRYHYKVLSELASDLPVPQSQGQVAAPPKLPVSLPLPPRQNPQTPL